MKLYAIQAMYSASDRVFPNGEKFFWLPNYRCVVYEQDGPNRLAVKAMHSNPNGLSTKHGRGITSICHCSSSYTK